MSEFPPFPSWIVVPPLAPPPAYPPQPPPLTDQGLALLPGISLAALSSGAETYGGVALIESAAMAVGTDNLMWHVQDVRERQREVERAEQTVWGDVDAIKSAAAVAGAADAPAPDPAPATPLAFGPTHWELAQRFYRDTALPAPRPTEREGRSRKRKSRWETAEEAGAIGSALALVSGGAGVPDEAAIKAHLAGIVGKIMPKSEDPGAMENGVTPAESDDPEVVRQYARYTDVAQRIASNEFADERRGETNWGL